MVGLRVDEIGQSIPPNTPHAVSVSLPTWKATIGYEEGEEWVLSKMKTGYPRFYIHDSIARLANAIVQTYGHQQEQALLFPSHGAAWQCVGFLRAQDPSLLADEVRVVNLVSNPEASADANVTQAALSLSAAIFPAKLAKAARCFWQHTGEGISSRRADHFYQLCGEEIWASNANDVAPRSRKGPRRYQRQSSVDEDSITSSTQRHEHIRAHENASQTDPEGKEHSVHIEERYGRNLNISLVTDARLAIKKRIAGLLTADVELDKAVIMPVTAERVRLSNNMSEEDVYLYPSGMSSIFNCHRTLLSMRGPLKSICFGFPYIDTLKILQKWGPGCIFYGNGSSEDLKDLESRLEQGEQYLALFCEFPSNPLLKSPNLRQIRTLADKFNFAVVVDETVGNFLNVRVLPYADVVVSSLTKIFSGDSNVMGGSAVLNPRSRMYKKLEGAYKVHYEDNYWAEDVLVMERNSRDFASRIDRININADAICEILKKHPRVKGVFYPKHNPDRLYYDQCRRPNGGYGGLLSVTFFTTAEAVTFFDRLEICKGPSLGTNFTLSCPYTLLAHYGELEWAASFGVETNLVRVSVGLEESKALVTKFEKALAAVVTLGTCHGL